MYQLEKISKEQIEQMVAMGHHCSRGYKLGARKKLLLDFVNSGELISKVNSNSKSSASNLNSAARQYKINVRAFRIGGQTYIANLALIDGQK